MAMRERDPGAARRRPAVRDESKEARNQLEDYAQIE